MKKEFDDIDNAFNYFLEEFLLNKEKHYKSLSRKERQEIIDANFDLNGRGGKGKVSLDRKLRLLSKYFKVSMKVALEPMDDEK